MSAVGEYITRPLAPLDQLIQWGMVREFVEGGETNLEFIAAWPVNDQSLSPKQKSHLDVVYAVVWSVINCEIIVNDFGWTVQRLQTETQTGNEFVICRMYLIRALTRSPHIRWLRLVCTKADPMIMQLASIPTNWVCTPRIHITLNENLTLWSSATVLEHIIRFIGRCPYLVNVNVSLKGWPWYTTANTERVLAEHAKTARLYLETFFLPLVDDLLLPICNRQWRAFRITGMAIPRCILARLMELELAIFGISNPDVDVLTPSVLQNINAVCVEFDCISRYQDGFWLPLLYNKNVGEINTALVNEKNQLYEDAEDNDESFTLAPYACTCRSVTGLLRAMRVDDAARPTLFRGSTVYEILLDDHSISGYDPNVVVPDDNIVNHFVMPLHRELRLNAKVTYLAFAVGFLLKCAINSSYITHDSGISLWCHQIVAFLGMDSLHLEYGAAVGKLYNSMYMKNMEAEARAAVVVKPARAAHKRKLQEP